MNSPKKITLLFVSLFSLISLPSSASVRSITTEFDAVVDGERVGKKVVVSCRGSGNKREIMKKNDAKKWCDTAIADFCFSEKIEAAKQVCSNAYRNKITLVGEVGNDKEPVKKNAGSIKSVEVVKLKEELIEIEQKRLDIADKMLKLKRRELQLQDGT